MVNQNDSWRKVGAILMRPGIDSFNRMDEFLSIQDTLTHQEYWYGLQFAYTGSDNLFHLSRRVKKAFYSSRPLKEYMMDAEELEHFKNLPKQVQVYRGMTEAEFESGNFGVGWSLRQDVAEFFAYKYIRNVSTSHMPKVVVTASISNEYVLGYLNGRNEDELIIRSEMVDDFSLVDI